MHVLQKLKAHASITTTRDFYLRVGDTSEREATGRYGRLVSGAEAASDPGYETDAKMTPDDVGG